jgi:hypothetical protein
MSEGNPMITRAILGVMVTILVAGCVVHDVDRSLMHPAAFTGSGTSKTEMMRTSSPFLKVHMRNGNLYLYDVWNTTREGSEIGGHAVLYSPARDTLQVGDFSLGLDSIALLETNVIQNSGSASALTVYTGVTAAFTLYCIANPKACFGSCPTFYVSDGDSMRLQAEGFSSSIAPSLEATDVDALYHARAQRGEVMVEMRNEALETHVVRYADLLAVPHEKGNRVLAAPNREFWDCATPFPPMLARSPEGDCLSALSKPDGVERFSRADEAYLGAKEIVELEFSIRPDQPYGIVVGCRQTLLPTYLLYQTYAYMGNEAGYWLAELERKRLPEKNEMDELIGGIEILVMGADCVWREAGMFNEHGPLATDMHMLPVGEFAGSTLHVQLRMTKGVWRVDYVGLAELLSVREPIRLQPMSVSKNGEKNERALKLLQDSTQVLVTFPGDTYELRYTLPSTDVEYEFFMESRGYYLEWIREEWIREENPFLLAQTFLDPRTALHRMAPEFKCVEPNMEDCF